MAAGDIGMDEPGFFHRKDGRMALRRCFDSKVGKALEKFIAAGRHGINRSKLRAN